LGDGEFKPSDRRRQTRQEEDERVEIIAKDQNEWRRILVDRQAIDAEVEALIKSRSNLPLIRNHEVVQWRGGECAEDKLVRVKKRKDGTPSH
jgi:hypothetical protein